MRAISPYHGLKERAGMDPLSAVSRNGAAERNAAGRTLTE